MAEVNIDAQMVRSAAPRLVEMSNGRIWWADLPLERWPARGSEHRRWIEDRWQQPYGDRRQEIVFIGQDLPREEILCRLDACLLESAELQAPGEKYENTVNLAFK